MEPATDTSAVGNPAAINRPTDLARHTARIGRIVPEKDDDLLIIADENTPTQAERHALATSGGHVGRAERCRRLAIVKRDWPDVFEEMYGQHVREARRRAEEARLQ